MSSAASRDFSDLIVFAGGGTGGHLYPSLAVVRELQEHLPEARFLFFGTQRAIDERVLAATGFELVRQTLAPLQIAPWRWPRILMGLRRSSALCRAHFEKDRPAVVIGTGGLGCVPAVRQAHKAGIPVALFNPDALPGRANRFLAGQADVVFAQWEETTRHFPRGTDVRVCGCPIRPEFQGARRTKGLTRFELDEKRHTLLVTGASLGARTLNEAVLANLDFLESQRKKWQVVHLTGQPDFERVRNAYAERSLRAVVRPFVDDMADVLASADLVIARAGASTLAEITAVGRPAILMPYPYHRDRHQQANARCLVQRGAAKILDDEIDPAVNGPALRRLLQPLINDDAERETLATAARRMGRTLASVEVAAQIVNLMERREPALSGDSVEQPCEVAR